MGAGCVKASSGDGEPAQGVVKPLATAAEAHGPVKSIVVWGTAGVTEHDLTYILHGLYIIARVGPAGSSWASKPRSAGRRSGMVDWNVSNDWALAFTVDTSGIKDPEVHIRCYVQDWTCEDDFLGEVRARLRDLPDSKEGRELHLCGKFAKGSIFVSSGPREMLEALGVEETSLFEKLAPIGKEKSVKVEDISGDGPFILGKAPLPKVMRGLFWMSFGGGDGLAAFGGPNRNGGGCSLGQITDKRYIIRTNGDRVWSFLSPDSTGRLSKDIDLIYHFTFDDAENPTKVNIIPEARELGLVLEATWLLEFEGILESQGDDQFPGSVVWKRPSYFLGEKLDEYKLVQVLDENGNRIHPAWDILVQWMSSPEKDGDPGVIFYKELEPHTNCA